MDKELLRRIVRVEARFANRKPKIGTGFRVGPGQVLTAQHVVERGHSEKAIERAAEIRIQLDDGSGENVREAPARVSWVGESKLDPRDHKALDAVLLADELPGDDLEPFRDWVRVPLGSSGRWETLGFASASPDAKAMGMEYLEGVCQPAREMATYLKLTVDRQPPRPGKDGAPATWAGVSGGPVFAQGGRYGRYLYGVVRSSPKRFEDALYAVGTPALLRNVDLRAKLGIDEPAPPHASLVERLREILEEDESLAGRLASLDEAWNRRWQAGGNDELVDVLCEDGRLKPVLERLRRLHRGEDPKSAAGVRIRELAVLLASILASRELPGGEHLDVESIRRIRLGTASPNFAEALLASAYGTPCLYEEVPGDAPRAWLRVPTATMEAGMRAPSQVGEQLEELLAYLTEKDLADARFLLPAMQAQVGTLPPGKRSELYRRLLRRSLARIEERHGRAPYLAADAVLQKKMGSHLETFLGRLGAILPNLDLVVLEAGSEPVERSIEEDDALYPLWEILDLLPDLRSDG